MVIGRTCESLLERIDAQPLFKLHPALQSGPDIGAVNVPIGRQQFEIGKFVVGRNLRAGLAGALDLGDLDQRLPLGAAAGIFRRHRLVVSIVPREG